jgi:hypothetical protein
MNRLLAIGAKIPRLTCVELSSWNTLNLLDYQGILFDCREEWVVSDAQGLANELLMFLSNGHSVFLILPEARNLVKSSDRTLRFIPRVDFSLGLARGKTLKLQSQLAVFHAYAKSLEGHDSFISTSVVNGSPWRWEAAITDNVSRAVCGKFHGLFAFHPPVRNLEGLALEAIFQHFKPDFEQPELPPTPAWGAVEISEIPGVIEAEALVGQIENEIESLESKRSEQLRKKDDLAKWAGLLWLDGIPLQDLVEEAFRFIGFETKSKDPTGHTHDFVAIHSTQVFLVEVTGASGSISLDKGRQLMQWIADSDDPATSKGVLVGNAFRSEPPGQRPPTPNHKIFVKELENLATKRGLALVDTRALLRLVKAKLQGSGVEATGVARLFMCDGEIIVPEFQGGGSQNATNIA